MKGLRVKSYINNQEKLQKVAIPDAVVAIMVNVKSSDSAFWSISGMEGNIHLTWDGGSLGVGDEIEVELTEIEEPTPCLNKVAHETLIERMAKIEKQDTNEQEIQEWKLQRYYRLKKILEEEGLL